jgi:hypothetical protein
VLWFVVVRRGFGKVWYGLFGFGKVCDDLERLIKFLKCLIMFGKVLIRFGKVK